MIEKKRWLETHIEESVVPSAPDVDLSGIRRFLGSNEIWLDHSVRFLETYVRVMRYVRPRRDWLIAETGVLSATARYLAFDGFQVEPLAGDFRYRIDAPSCKYDFLLSCEVFEHIKDQDAKSFDDLVVMNFSGVQTFICEMYRVIRPGGLLALTTPNACSLLNLKLILDYRAPALFWPHVKEYPPSEVIERCEAAGFETVNWDTFFGMYFLDQGRSKLLHDMFTLRGAATENRGEVGFFLFRKPERPQAG